MYHDSYYDYKCSVMNDFIEKEMQRYKKNAVQAISQCVHFEIEAFTKVLGFAYFESQADAENLAHTLNLSKIDFFAVTDDIDGFREEYLKDQELAQNF